MFTSDDEFFCSSPGCVLHKPLQDGRQWATVDGIWVDRSLVGGRYLCLFCRRGLTLMIATATVDEPRER